MTELNSTEIEIAVGGCVADPRTGQPPSDGTTRRYPTNTLLDKILNPEPISYESQD